MKTPENSRMLTHMATSKSQQRGFTLIELMVTVAVLAIIATIATTSYTSQIRKSRRTDARSAVLDLAGREEKLFSTANAYSQTATDLGYAAWGPIGSNYYSLSVLSPDTLTQGGAAGTYLATATPVAGSSQASDTECTSLRVDQTGKQSSTGSAPVETCWGN